MKLSEIDRVEHDPWGSQQHVFRWWRDLTPFQQDHLLRQLEGLDRASLEQQYAKVKAGEAAPLPDFKPLRPENTVQLKDAPKDGSERESTIRLGQRALAGGQVAVVLVAGGQGTRLGHDGPKGTFAIGPVSGKSLFQIHAEKVLALGYRYGAPVPLCVMTSHENDDATQEFFEHHNFFGLDPEQVIFFQQGMMPVLDRETGKLLMTDRHSVAVSPDGHGGVFRALAEGGHLGDLRRRGVEFVFYYQVDNPMVKVADPIYLGHHIKADAEMSLKVVRKRQFQEEVGVVVEVGDRMQIIEYSDLPEEIAKQRQPDGSLKIWAGSIAVHIFNISFIESLTAGPWELPYHPAIKKVRCLDEAGRMIQPTEPNALKFEMFVFDALPLARKALVVETDRKEEFEPLKNADGENSPTSVRQAMSDLHASWLTDAEVQVPYRPDGSVAVPIEISPLLALDAEQLRQRLPWRGPVNEPLLLDERSELVRRQAEEPRRDGACRSDTQDRSLESQPVVEPGFQPEEAGHYPAVD